MATWNLPTWNAYCAIWWPSVAKTSPPSAVSICQLRHVRLNATELLTSNLSINPPGTWCWILFPAGTDVRRSTSATAPTPSNDWLTTTRIQLPAGSTRWYAMATFEDRAAGFANEHRAAWCFRSNLDATPLPKIGGSMIEPVITTCGGHTLLAKKYRIDIAGITGFCAAGGGTCDVMNGSYTITHQAACGWGPLTLPTCNGVGFDLLTLDWSNADTLWHVQFAGAHYTATQAAFNRFGTTTFNRTANVGPCSYPLTITVTAV